MARIFSRVRSVASSLRVFFGMVRQDWKVAFRARELSRFTGYDLETTWRIIHAARRDGIEALHVYYVMNALNVGVDDAMKIISDPDTQY